MRFRSAIATLLLAASLLVSSSTLSSVEPAPSDSGFADWHRNLPMKPVRTELSTNHRRDVILVKFRDDSLVRVAGDSLASDREAEQAALDSLHPLLDGAQATRVMRQDDATLAEWRENAVRNLGRDVADLSKLVHVAIPQASDAAEIINAFNRLAIVELASPVAHPAPPPQSDYTSQQGYLFSAPSGVNAQQVWTSYGVSGQGVKVSDIEWNFEPHVDFPSIAILNSNNPSGGSADHGTRTFGVMASQANGWGTTGIAPSATYHFATHLHPANHCSAIGDSVAALSAGDVIVLEAQWNPGISGQGYVPVEWDYATYQCVATAVGNHRVVVMAAGNRLNGYDSNLDDSVFAGGHAPFSANDSGSIIVGAGRSPNYVPQRSHNQGSYGNRVNVQGWGLDVFTTDAGNSYTAGYNGTSSATAIVGGVAALVQSAYKSVTGQAASPAAVRNALIATGSAQQTPPSNRHIGPLPDAYAATQFLLGYPPTPSNFWVEETGCFGYGWASWNATSGTVTHYDLQGAPTSAFVPSQTWTEYSGPNTGVSTSIWQTSWFRVRACNGGLCSSYSSPRKQDYYSWC